MITSAWNENKKHIAIVEEKREQLMTGLARLALPSATDTQRLIIMHIALPSKDIGNILGMAPRTVEKHIEVLFKKYKTNSRIRLALLLPPACWVLTDITLLTYDRIAGT